MQATDDALWAIAKNAIRHLEEANQHYRERRWASAVMAGVFAIEETGKLIGLGLHGVTYRKNAHAAHAGLFVVLMQVGSEWSLYREWAALIRDGISPEAVLTAGQEQTIAQHPEFANFVRRLQSGELQTGAQRASAWGEAKAEKDRRDGTRDRWQPLYDEGLQKMRLRATYTDVSPTGAVSSPESIAAAEAEAICSLGCMHLMLILVVLLFNGRMRSHIGEVDAVLSGNILGQAEFNRLVSAFAPGGPQVVIAAIQAQGANDDAPPTLGQ